MAWVPDDFEVPRSYEGRGFHLEPLSPAHNERDHEAWMSSIDHIHRTPGMESWTWPQPMSLDENMADMEMHYAEFENREGFTYSVLDGNDVIGCVYIYPDKTGSTDASVRSWVTEHRSEMEAVVWEDLSGWFLEKWPFRSISYQERPPT